MSKQPKISKKIKKKPKVIKKTKKNKINTAIPLNNSFEPKEIIAEKSDEGKKYVMKNLKLEEEFESFYSHGEAKLVGNKYFGKCLLLF